MIGFRVVKLDGQTKILCGEPANRRCQRIGGIDQSGQGLHQAHAGIEQFLFGVQHIKRGTAADHRFALHAIKRDFLGPDLGAHAFHLGAGGAQSFPGLRGLLPGEAPCIFHQLALLLRLLARLAHGGVFGATLKDGDGKIGSDLRTRLARAW
jgi:hypothetical protein